MSHGIMRLLFLLSLLVLSDTLFARIYLVAAGIADYPGKNNDLILPAKDAQTIVGVYANNSDIQYKLLLNKEATAGNILNAVSKLFAKASANDIVVLFFSGHGYKGGFMAYNGALSYAKLRSALAKSKARNKMVFADACFSGKMRTTGRAEGSMNDIKDVNVMLFLSSRNNEQSIEAAYMQNGFFTTFLQKGLRGGADSNRDRTITARELYEYVKQGVVEMSRGKQHPVMWGNFSDNMPVMKW